ncbi:J domain-containing protein [Vibrio parahaemolyticus]|uniref:DnaJ C-terminal domain-containing protein n=1 Tax=Vibrio TaxID=662 RepID=UPI0003ED92E3|nr:MULTISPECIES: DnaJ C-terminal domain-containing protein [Vibrio]AHI98740.1 DnaJ-class molecular chaperone CbpA [Vibrio parahaemolyticus UCM-V493]TBT35781.1 J domain-containing protein [Vibrio parahaemolyticus]
MEFKDYYKVLGVKRDATLDDIKRAYRRMARKYHPDVSDEPDAEERFKAINEAHEVLKDPEKRAAYDQLGANWKAGQDFQPPPGWEQGFEFNGGGFTNADADNFSDFFESLFGQSGFSRGFGGRRRGFHAQGNDIHAKITIDLQDAFNGASRNVTLKHPEVGVDGRSYFKERSLNVKIPKGVREGQSIRLAGQGEPGVGDGKAGDLYLEVQFKPHPYYRVDGKDIYVDLPVAPWEAALGATVNAPTPIGSVNLKIPPGSDTGKKLRLKGRGIPAKTPGDLYVMVKVVLPKADSEKTKQAYEAFQKACYFDPREHMGV